MKVKRFAIVIGLLASFSLSAQTAQEIAKVYCDLDRVPDFNYSTLLLENVDRSGKSEVLEVKQYGSGVDNGLKNVAFDFKAPANVKGTRVLQLEKLKKADDRWVYQPKLRQARRIVMSERTKSFGGTELTYNDMTIRNEDEDKNTIVDNNAKITVNGTSYTCWKMKSEPYKKSEVEYHYRLTWFDKKTYIPVRIEFYDSKDKMIKTYECHKIDMVKGVTGIEYPLRRKSVVSNLITGRKTIVTVKDFVFDEPISDGYFTQNWLINGKSPKMKSK